ncbi:hypothetical protein [Nocardiopsis sp. LOL_012]|uniref:hypothetical protein n=1 Tax=Nocardiopsis sp. LOL_012 TaxID=3345409 RepID=UPI003A86EF2C
MATPNRRHRHLVPFGPAPGQTRLITLELEPEVAAKLDAIREDEYVVVLRLAEMLALMGRRLTEPQVKPLGERVYELRLVRSPSEGEVMEHSEWNLSEDWSGHAPNGVRPCPPSSAGYGPHAAGPTPTSPGAWA